MKQKYKNIKITFNKENLEFANTIYKICEDIPGFLKNFLKLSVENVRVHIIRSPFDFSPFSFERLLFLIVHIRDQSIWEYSPAWELFGTVYIKTWEGVQKTNKSKFENIFYDNVFNSRLKNLICHELTHVATRHLHLPLWMSEGIAIYTAEKYIGNQTVKLDTLNSLKASSSLNDVNLSIRGYWATRFLFETNYDFINEFLQSKRNDQEILKSLSGRYEIEQKDFWHHFNTIIFEHFTNKKD